MTSGAWKIEQTGKKPVLKDPILIEGLPGIGNVGKVAVDFMIDELNAKKLYDISSHTFPHSVFVNEENLVELPKIEIYYKRFRNRKHDLLLLAGDVQPADEVSCYDFSEKMIDMAKRFRCREVITIGGIGLQEIPKNPKVYCTGNNHRIINRYKRGVKMSENLYGVVGPIVGVSGVLLGLAGKRDLEGIAFISETFGHPMYLGIKGAREVLKILNKKLDLGLDIRKLDKSIAEIEKESVKKTEGMSDVTKRAALKKLSKLASETSYIG